MSNKVDLTDTSAVGNNQNVHMSHDEIATVLNISVKEVKEAERSALNKMRHPRLGKVLKNYIKTV